MHPLIARFLDLSTTVVALEKGRENATLDADEAALNAIAEEEPALASAVLKAKGQKHPSATVQEQLIVLTTRAATRRVAQDPALGPATHRAIDALKSHGAAEAEAWQLVAQAVLEEAFGFAEDPAHFDAPFLQETLDSLVHLAGLNTDLVADWLDAFVRRAPAGRALRVKVAETLLEAAWGDGPQPISPEHLDDALEQLADALPPADFATATTIVDEFLTYLASRYVVGTERLARLKDILRSAATSGEHEGDEDEEADDSEFEPSAGS